jgi:ribosomal protein L37AE/L43A
MDSDKIKWTKCKFCEEMLDLLDHDSKNLWHCQICHIVYDGFAQHTCEENETESEEDI